MLKTFYTLGPISLVKLTSHELQRLFYEELCYLIRKTGIRGSKQPLEAVESAAERGWLGRDREYVANRTDWLPRISNLPNCRKAQAQQMAGDASILSISRSIHIYKRQHIGGFNTIPFLNVLQRFDMKWAHVRVTGHLYACMIFRIQLIWRRFKAFGSLNVDWLVDDRTTKQ